MQPYHDLWFRLFDKERYLYHYTKAQTALRYILPSGSLMLAKLSDLNDPREYKDWTFDALTVEGRDLGFPLDLYSRFNHKIRSVMNVACFCRDVFDSEAVFADHVGNCYERGHSRPRMWAQYADNYRGVCLVFDRLKLLRHFQEFARKRKLSYRDGAVTYANRNPIPSVLTMNETTIDYDRMCRMGFARYAEWHVSEYFDKLFLSKNRDWCDEREFRIAVYGHASKDLIVPFGDSLVGVAVGDRSADLSQEMLAACSGKNIDVAIMNWKNGYPQPWPANLRQTSA